MSTTDLEWIARPIKVPYAPSAAQARECCARMTPSAGALGLFEELAVRLAGWQRCAHPVIDPARVVIFAADHGVAAASLRTTSHPTTRSLVYDCLRGNAPLVRLTRQLGVAWEIVDVGMYAAPADLPPPVGVQNQGGAWHEQPVASGSADFRFGSAMTPTQFSRALQVGREAVLRLIHDKARIFIGGEVGVGGKMAACAVACALLRMPPECLLGGTDLPTEGSLQVEAAIQQGLDVHVPFHDTAMESLRRLGGLEMAALTGAFITCGQRGIPAIVDGFVASAAALVAIAAHPPLKEWLIFAHSAAEPGHLSILQELSVRPVLDLNLCWGLATGAVAALPILRMACQLLAEQTTAA